MIERIAGAAARLGGWATLAITLLVSFDVLMRYLLNAPQLFVDEIAGFLQVYVIFGGLAYTFLTGGHVRVDLLTTHLAPVRRARLRVLTLAAGLAVLLIVSWVTAQSTLTAYDYGRVSTVMLYPLWLPMALIPIGLLLFALVLGGALVRQVRTLRGRGAEADEIRLS